MAKEQGLNVILGNNLQLDLSDSVSDLTVSEGVIHHTVDPAQCFRELVRITKPGGWISLYVYNRQHLYYWIYSLCAPIRFLHLLPLGRELTRLVFFPLFNLLYVQLGNLIFFGGKRKVSWKLAWNIFSDQILTPIAHFFRDSEIRTWANEHHLNVIATKRSVNGQGLMFVFEKPVT